MNASFVYACETCPNQIEMRKACSVEFLLGYRGLRGPICQACRDRMYLMTSLEIERMITTQAVTDALRPCQ